MDQRLTRDQYQEKYRSQLEALDLVGYYKMGSGKDSSYFTSFEVSELLDYYHLGTITYGFFYNPDTKNAVVYWETDWDREGLEGFDNPLVSSIYGGDYPLDVYEDYRVQCKIALDKENEKRRQRRFELGIIEIGDTVQVVKGRKVPIGTIGIVKEFSKFYDKYGRWVSTYAIFTDGTKTNRRNLKLIKQADIER